MNPIHIRTVVRRGIVSEWQPVLDRGDGVWLGVVENGLAVGSREVISKRIAGSNYVPLWPLLEGDFDETLELLAGSWNKLSSGGVETPERLMQLVVGSAVAGGSRYWIELSMRWLERMVNGERFDQSFVEHSLEKVKQTAQGTQSLKHQALRALGNLRRQSR